MGATCELHRGLVTHAELVDGVDCQCSVRVPTSTSTGPTLRPPPTEDDDADAEDDADITDDVTVGDTTPFPSVATMTSPTMTPVVLEVTAAPAISNSPSALPRPAPAPIASPTPTLTPAPSSAAPWSAAPTSSVPSSTPTPEPTAVPATSVPTTSPTLDPTAAPIMGDDSSVPTGGPTAAPSVTSVPTNPQTPTPAQSPSTLTPTSSPSTDLPTDAPTADLCGRHTCAVECGWDNATGTAAADAVCGWNWDVPAGSERGSCRTGSTTTLLEVHSGLCIGSHVAPQLPTSAPIPIPMPTPSPATTPAPTLPPTPMTVAPVTLAPTTARPSAAPTGLPTGSPTPRPSCADTDRAAAAAGDVDGDVDGDGCVFGLPAVPIGSPTPGPSCANTSRAAAAAGDVDGDGCVFGLPAAPTGSPTPGPSCTDTDRAAAGDRDVDGDGCAYYTRHPQHCGGSSRGRDTVSFSATAMCCACGGGRATTYNDRTTLPRLELWIIRILDQFDEVDHRNATQIRSLLADISALIDDLERQSPLPLLGQEEIPERLATLAHAAARVLVLQAQSQRTLTILSPRVLFQATKLHSATASRVELPAATAELGGGYRATRSWASLPSPVSQPAMTSGETDGTRAMLASYLQYNSTVLFPVSRDPTSQEQVPLGSLITCVGYGGDASGNVSAFEAGGAVLTSFDIEREAVANSANHECRYWDTKSLRWSTEGCSRDDGGGDQGAGGNDTARCRCTHLTSFAVMMAGAPSGSNARAGASSEEHATALSILTYVGMSISMVCMVLTLVLYTIFPAARTFPKKVLMHLVLALLVTLILFIVSASTNLARNDCKVR